MLAPNTILGFATRFIVVCGLLILPWPGWNQLYGQYFRQLGNLTFGHYGDRRFMKFTPYSETRGFSSVDTEITLGNLVLMDQAGNGPAKILKFDTRSQGWVPTAQAIALILATPLPWKRRVRALLLGLLLVHLFLFLTVQIWIWDESSDLSLSIVSPFWQTVLDNLEYTFLQQIGVSFFFPTFIWVLVCFRPKDLQALGYKP